MKINNNMADINELSESSNNCSIKSKKIISNENYSFIYSSGETEYLNKILIDLNSESDINSEDKEKINK